MKICIVTGSRAEFGILENLIKKLNKDKFFNIDLIVTGSHLSRKYGSTINEIIKRNQRTRKMHIICYLFFYKKIPTV